ncbi:MAG: hypothetical protein QOJ15_6634, partial [Bradyrhizobium sp.]|nr:hypothetical protein [Bradyrhizobium sp.]
MAITTIKDLLATFHVLENVVLPSEIGAMLSALEVTDPNPPPAAMPASGILRGHVKLTTDLSTHPLPGLDFFLSPPDAAEPAPFKLMIDTPTAFKFWLVLSQDNKVFLAFKFLDALPGFALTGASKTTRPDGRIELAPLPGADPKKMPRLVSRSQDGSQSAPSLLIQGSSGAPAGMRFTPDTDPDTEGVVAIGLEPSTVVFGNSKFGFDLPSLVIDDSEMAKAPGNGAPGLNPPLAPIPADQLNWRGILARELDFYLPADVPLFGGQAIKGYYAIGFGASGVDLVVESKVPPQGGHPGYGVRIECRDPTAKGLSGLVPTLITATMELPLDGNLQSFSTDGGGSESLKFAAGKPVIVTATFARNPLNADKDFKITLGVAAQGSDGIVSVTSPGGGAGAKIFNTTAALATALIAEKDPPKNADVGGTAGVLLPALLAVGGALSMFFSDDSKFVLHGVEIAVSSAGSSAGGLVVLMLDYSVAIRVAKIDVGAFSIEMSENQPMRIRMRGVRFRIDPSQSGLSMAGLDFDHATMEIENPGAWKVGGLDQLFDVLGSRSGRGSTWIEVDLRFKLNLGPIKVSGVTIRATLDNGVIGVSIRGLEASISIPGTIKGTGGLQLKDGGFAANMSVSIIPLNVTVDAGINYDPPMVALDLSVDLPAPIPLANSGFGLFGIGGVFGISAVPDYSTTTAQDPILQQLEWEPVARHFKPQAGQFSFGLGAVVGTFPDLGFSFSAKAGVLISAPDIAVRASLNGRVLQPVMKMADSNYPPPPGLSFLGIFSIDREAVSFGLLGSFNLQPLLQVNVPLAGHFPLPPHDTSDWYVYLGADGYPGGSPNQGRGIGPISATVLPDILHVSADAYVMLRGNGIENWPYQRAMTPTSPGGFIVAFGFALQNEFGPKPVTWAELYASVDILIGAKPPILAGFGCAGGSLHLGPFSLGVQAQVAFMIAEQKKYFMAQVTGKIELFFFDIEGTVTISYGDEPALVVPDPDRHPLDRLDGDGNRIGSLGSLTDDTYRVVAQLVENPDHIVESMHVWPDAMISLPFAISPTVNPTSHWTQFPAIEKSARLPAATGFGSDMLHYDWSLDRVELFDVTDVTAEADKFNGGTKVSGVLLSQWQTPRTTTAAGADVNELLLLSSSADLWINRLADSGANVPDNPLQSAANICQLSVAATRGWAVGYLAGETATGFRIPPDPLPLTVLDSRVEAAMTHVGVTPLGEEIPVDHPSFLPLPFSVQPAALVTWPIAMKIERNFVGHLVAPCLSLLPGLDSSKIPQSVRTAFTGQRVDFSLTEAIRDGEIILVANRALFAFNELLPALRVTDDSGHFWKFSGFVQLPTGE